MSVYVKYVPTALGGGGGGGGGVTTVGALDGNGASADGASIVGAIFYMQSASATFPGLVNLAAQTFAGTKTFSSIINANGGIDRSTVGTLTIGATNSNVINIGNAGATVNIQGSTIYENTPILQVTDPLITVNHGGGAGSGQNSGIEVEEAGSVTGYAETSSDRNSWILKAPNTAGIATITPGAGGITLDQSSHNPVTLGTPNGLSLATQQLSLALSSGSTTGALSSTDWTAFDAKQPAGSYLTALTGDGTATGPGSAAFTLATVNGNVGSFGTATDVSSFTVNGKGLITAASNTPIQIAESQVTNLVSDLAGKQATGNYITALTGDVTAIGPGSSAATLATVNSNVGSFTYASISVNAKGLITAASSGAAPTGTVTSVALSVPATSILSVTGSPITTSGTLALATTGTSGGIPYFSSTSQLASSALLTANALVLGGGAGSSPTSLGSLGTTTTVLHGNAAGAPTFGAVSLTADVSGTLPVANGGTGAATANAGTYFGGPYSGAAAAPSFKAFQAPTIQRFTSGSGTYTTATGALYITVEMAGGGGGGSGSGTSPGAPGTAGDTTFGSNTAAKGAAASGAAAGGGGSATVGTGTTIHAMQGGAGGSGVSLILGPGGQGGATALGGGGGGGQGTGAAGASGKDGIANSGAAGGGAGAGNVSGTTGAGGGAGAYIKVLVTSPAASYSYGVGAGGTGGTAGTNGSAGGSGGSGVIVVTEYYQ